MSHPNLPNPAEQTEAFGVLNSETRLRIIQELAMDRRVDWAYDGRTFADLRRSVGVRDAGTFAYHLDQLQDRFVTTRDDEYVLTDAGLEVADLLAAGTLDPARLAPERTTTSDTPCPSCTDRLRVRYENSRCAVCCPDHGVIIVNSLPPAMVCDHDGEDLLRYILRDIHQELEDARHGVCFHCGGRMVATIQTDTPLFDPVSDEPLAETTQDVTVDPVLTVYGCERCNTVFWADPRWLLLRHPAVLALFHTVDLSHYSFLEPTIRRATTEPVVTATDPPRVRVTYVHESETLELVLDATKEVAEVDTAV